MKLLNLPDKELNRSQQYNVRYMLIFSGGMLTHTVLAGFFLMAGRPALAALNAASLAGYLLWLVRLSSAPLDLPGLLFLYADVTIHASFCNILLGKEPGFFLYPFIIIPLSFFLTGQDLPGKRTPWVTLGVSMLSLILTLAALRIGPLRPFTDSAQNERFFHINALLSALLLSIYTSRFMTETLNAQTSLSSHAETDQLTGLLNRYGFQHRYASLRGMQHCLIMGDIDGFKQVNDLYGHSVGDYLLAEIGKTLLVNTRREDVLCRWGGEEFLLAIRADRATCLAILERIRRKLTTVAVEAGETAVSVTMTFGVADCLEAESFEDLSAIADENLLRGKRSGKNCVICSDTDMRISPERPAAGAELNTAFLEERMFNAFAATSDSTYIYLCNLNTDVSRWSRTAVDYFGLPGEYMQDAGSIWLGFIHPNDREAYSRDLEAVLSGRKHFHDISYRARNRNGEYVRLLCKGVVTEGDAEHPAMFAGTITNLGRADDSSGKLRI